MLKLPPLMIRISASWAQRVEGSFVTVKLDPPPFLGGVPFSRETGVFINRAVIDWYFCSMYTKIVSQTFYT